MARMLPAEPSGETQSSAERRVFDLIKAGLGDEWYGLHSLGLTGHWTKPWAEIDFVLIGPPGILCLEVKGGRVARADGMWHFTDRRGATSTKAEGPWHQAATAAAALKQHLVENLPHLRDVVVGSGVVMPDITFNLSGPDVQPETLYDQRWLNRGIAAFVRHLCDYWSGRLRHDRGLSVRMLTPQDREAVKDHFRGDFDLRPSLRTRLKLVNDELLRLTNEQYHVLQELEDNDRVLIRGGAGTGKTLLAVEEALRLGRKGGRVLFCCFNRNLASYIRRALSDSPNVDVYHLHGFMAHMVRQAGLDDRLRSYPGEELFTTGYPKVCEDALVALQAMETYDAIIVDEAQDLLRRSYLDILDAVLKRGLKGGTWRIFYDPNQSLFGGMDERVVDQLNEGSPTRCNLSRNCRNTQQIAYTTALLSGVDLPRTLGADGPDIEEHRYHSPEEQRRQISRNIARLLSEGVQPADIVILATRRLENTCLSQGLDRVPAILVEFGEISEGRAKNAIQFATVQSFKGLEADAVLLIEIDTLGNPEMLSAIYVGASRARAYLSLFIDASREQEYRQRVAAFATKLAVHPGIDD